MKVPLLNLKVTISLTDSSIDDPILGITRFQLRGRAPIKNVVPTKENIII